MQKFSLLITALALSLFASANSYTLNNSDIDAMFAASENISAQILLYADGSAMDYQGAIETGQAHMIAGIVAISSFFVRIGASVFSYIPVFGWALTLVIWVAAIFPIHRFILGVDGEGFKIGALYCVTLGWCINAHHVVDGIFLLIDSGGDKYINNPKYVMWGG